MSVDPAHSSASDGHRAQRSRPVMERLRTLLLEEGGLMRSLVTDSSGGPARASGRPGTQGPANPSPEDVDPPPQGPAQLAASGPRVDGCSGDYELLLETIYEGYLLHYRLPRIVRPVEEDLGLLAGDRLYALGLACLVKLGDIEGVAELADVITLSALAHAGGQPELADAIWMGGARAVGWGASPQYERAKAMVRAASPDALEALRSFATVEG